MGKTVKQSSLFHRTPQRLKNWEQLSLEVRIKVGIICSHPKFLPACPQLWIVGWQYFPHPRRILEVYSIWMVKEMVSYLKDTRHIGKLGVMIDNKQIKWKTVKIMLRCSSLFLLQALFSHWATRFADQENSHLWSKSRSSIDHKILDLWYYEVDTVIGWLSALLRGLGNLKPRCELW